MKRCKVCVLPETFPEIKFNTDGVCSFCSEFELVPSRKKLSTKMEEIITSTKGGNAKYDTLVAYSGGKDSTFLAYTLKEKYGLNVLAFTFDNGFISEFTFSNMRNVLNNLDMDHLIFKPKYGFVNKIFSTSANSDVYPISLLKFGSSICISCIRMVNNLSLKTAIEKKIPTVMLGNSPGQIINSDSEIIYKDNVIPYQLKKKLFKPLADKLGDEVYYYFLLNEEQYKSKPFPYIINPLPIIGYDEKNIYQTISALGWVKPTDVDMNSTNCQLNSYGIVKHKERLKFHPYDYEMSMLVRLGKITREEALGRVEDKNGKLPSIAQDIAKILDRTDI